MIRFELKPDDGETHEVVADSRDIIAWEARTPPGQPRRHLGQIESAPRMTDMVELAWLAARRTKHTTADLDEFRNAVAVKPLAQAGTDEQPSGLLDPIQPGA
jgi:hypothetical protein